MMFLSNSSQHIYKLSLSLSSTHPRSFHVKIYIPKFLRKAKFLIKAGNAFPERLCPMSTCFQRVEGSRRAEFLHPGKSGSEKVILDHLEDIFLQLGQRIILSCSESNGLTL